MSTPLADQPVEPAADDPEPLTEDACEEYAASLGDAWTVVDGHHLTASYGFPDFETALAFTNDVGELAEAEWHHPDLALSWGEVGVELWSHEVGGLTRADFAMAARMDRIYADYDAE